MDEIKLTTIGFVRSSRAMASDDFWGQEVARIELSREFSVEALRGLDQFSHIEVVFHFHSALGTFAESRHPRGNPEWPVMGVFAQRGKDRPNLLGTTICELTAIEETTLLVSGLDAIDGTPVLDIKPVMRGFLPRTEVREPAWCAELMRDYWETRR